MGQSWWKRGMKPGREGSQPAREENEKPPFLKCPSPWLIPTTTQNYCYFSHLQTKQNKIKQSSTLNLHFPASYCSVSLLHFAADVLERVPYSLSWISLLPFFPKPTLTRLLSTETSLVKVTSDLHFTTHNDQCPGLISPGLLAPLDAADHFLLDTASALGSWDFSYLSGCSYLSLLCWFLRFSLTS